MIGENRRAQGLVEYNSERFHKSRNYLSPEEKRLVVEKRKLQGVCGTKSDILTLRLMYDRYSSNGNPLWPSSGTETGSHYKASG